LLGGDEIKERHMKVVRFLGDHLELLAWLGGLTFLALMNPYSDSLPSLCLFKRLGLPCPGCGLGRSISFLLHGDLQRSLQTHPLGIFALIVLVTRSVSLLWTACRVPKSIAGSSSL
jgi:hypothetical protein